MKIGIVVHGRFHAFDLARELIRAGHDVCLITNYPKSVAEKFGIPRRSVQSNLLHGIVSRGMQKLDQLLRRQLSEPFTHRWFGTWSAKVVAKKHFDVVHGFSGVFEETLLANDSGILKTLVRGSAHIETQYKLLAEEEQRAGLELDKPSQWIRAREQREYDLAHLIFVLSTFASRSFVERGVDPAKVRLLPLGTDCSRFRAAPDDTADRIERLNSGARLRILIVGTFSHRKGAIDLVRIGEALHEIAEFRFVGAIASDAADLCGRAMKVIQFAGKVPQFDLPRQYQWGDLFVFPTIEDGFAAVLAQAAAAGLPILATTNCAAPDIIKEGAIGWVFPIRRPDLIIERLRWCDEHREELAKMAQDAYQNFAPRDWTDVARDFANSCEEKRKERNQGAINVARA